MASAVASRPLESACRNPALVNGQRLQQYPVFGNDDEDEVDIEEIDTTEERVYSRPESITQFKFAVAIEQLELLEARFPLAVLPSKHNWS